MNDVRLISLNMHGVLIPDISIDVPHGVTVTVPADKAAKSKDLWRLISQKQIFRLNHGPFADFPQPAQPGPSQADLDHLRLDNERLEEQNRMLKQALDSQGGKLDAILGMLASGHTVGPVVVTAAPNTPSKDPALVPIEVPTYIPSEIKPHNVESHVEVASSTSEGSGVVGAGEALRRLRKKTA